ncbi:uncharacterized protein LOC127835155 [Dreissena polymorpha]|uniref:Uncharacterized protein n=1 Tax=Dreissena polymorpha TaxID=45954 RepID=A0A9D4GAZ3_DREPO|nr:uncharacterized protein LOC127835155 [Dreissena polymorpha]KAH3813507.1 hypothetical protein DPMN_141968 [Dreissena polymorpha]
MLLSSVNFVVKGGKSKDKKTREISEEEKEEKEVTCEACARNKLVDNSVFQFPNPSPTPSRTSQISDPESTVGDRVTITTGDDLCLSVDQFYYTIGLKSTNSLDSTCIFRKRVLETQGEEHCRTDTVVFALDCDRDFYLTTSQSMSLELNHYPHLSTDSVPEALVFLVYQTSLGHVMVRPRLHKNAYLHHLDSDLSIQQLNLNWRCPEEYFFHFEAVPESRNQSVTSSTTCPHHVTNESRDKVCVDSSRTCVGKERNRSRNVHVQKFVLPQNKDTVLLPTKAARKPQHFWKNLFIGCFSAKSHHLQCTSA